MCSNSDAMSEAIFHLPSGDVETEKGWFRQSRLACSARGKPFLPKKAPLSRTETVVNLDSYLRQHSHAGVTLTADEETETYQHFKYAIDMCTAYRAQDMVVPRLHPVDILSCFI